jgi:hypothetical protein
MTVKFKHSLDRAESTPRCGYMGQSYYELLTAIKTDQWIPPFNTHPVSTLIIFSFFMSFKVHPNAFS